MTIDRGAFVLVGWVFIPWFVSTMVLWSLSFIFLAVSVTFGPTVSLLQNRGLDFW